MIRYILIFYFLFLCFACNTSKTKNHDSAIYENIQKEEFFDIKNLYLFRRENTIIARCFNKNKDLEYLQIICKNDNGIKFKYGSKWLNMDSFINYYSFEEKVTLSDDIKRGILILNKLNLEEIYFFKNGVKMTLNDDRVLFYTKDSVLINQFNMDKFLINISNNIWEAK